jgi:threonyl-tRNA synthetase
LQTVTRPTPPRRFDLEYTGEAAIEKPVIVHRAILGSVERMFAILTEHFAGKWPFWLSPRQVMVVPISEQAYGYAAEVRAALRKAQIHVDADVTDRKMQKKVCGEVLLCACGGMVQQLQWAGALT